jgi:hypothetical protein
MLEKTVQDEDTDRKFLRKPNLNEILYAVVSLLRHVLPLRGKRSRSRNASDNTSMTNVLI